MPGNMSVSAAQRGDHSWMPKLCKATSRWTLAAMPTGETSPGPCQAVRMPKAAQRWASLRVGVTPPSWEGWTRMKSKRRLAMRGGDSRGWLKSSAMAMGVGEEGGGSRGVLEESAEGGGGGAWGGEWGEPGAVLGGEGVFEEEEPGGF